MSEQTGRRGVIDPAFVDALLDAALHLAECQFVGSLRYRKSYECQMCEKHMKTLEEHMDSGNHGHRCEVALLLDAAHRFSESRKGGEHGALCACPACMKRDDIYAPPAPTDSPSTKDAAP